MSIANGVADKGVTGGATSVTTSNNAGAGLTTQGSGSVIRLAITTADGTTVTIPADSKGNNYTQIGTPTFLAGHNKKITRFYCENATGGANHTATANLSPSDAATITLLEITGAKTSGALDATAVNGAEVTGAGPFQVASGTLAQANSLVVSDFSGDVGTNAASTEGSGLTKRAEEQNGASFYDLATASSSGSVGSTSSYTASWTRATAADCGVTIDVWKEAAGGPVPVLSSPTPSGTLLTTTTASIGASTTDTTGTGYVVVDFAANITGITAAQIKAGQNNAGGAPRASGNTAVSASPFAVSVSGLTPNQPYAYAIVQTNVNGDSNIVTGTFTTAAAPASLILGRRTSVFVTNEVMQS